MQDLIIKLLTSKSAISLISFIIGVVVTHYFTHKRKISELLFNSRKEAYTEFIEEYGGNFEPKELRTEEGLSELTKIQSNWSKSQKRNHLFSKCRLVAGSALESRLRDLYELILEIEDHANNPKEEKENSIYKLKTHERANVGYQVEACMRKDLKVIGYFEFLKWIIISNIEIQKVHKRLAKLKK